VVTSAEYFAPAIYGEGGFAAFFAKSAGVIRPPSYAGLLINSVGWSLATMHAARASRLIPGIY
jgi:hypothetical protein